TAHWSKDYVEHLRAVHFALIAACAAALLILLTSKPYDNAAAVKQLQGIIQLHNDWSVEGIARYLDRYSTLNTDKSQPMKTKVVSDCAYFKARDGKTYTIQTFGKSRRWVLLSNRSFGEMEDNQIPVSSLADTDKLGFPSTLAYFSQWWDSLPNTPLNV